MFLAHSFHMTLRFIFAFKVTSTLITPSQMISCSPPTKPHNPLISATESLPLAEPRHWPCTTSPISCKSVYSHLAILLWEGSGKLVLNVDYMASHPRRQQSTRGGILFWNTLFIEHSISEARLYSGAFYCKGQRLKVPQSSFSGHQNRCKFRCRSQWPSGLRRRSAAARLLRSWVRIPPRAWMFVCCEWCAFVR